MKEYTCREIKRLIRFVYSKKGDEYPDKIEEAYKIITKHLLRPTEKGTLTIACLDCYNYHDKIKTKHGF